MAGAMEGQRVLVTGAAGFIGFHLTQRLLTEGATVLGVDNLNTYYDPALKQARLRALTHPRFTFEALDIATQGSLAAAWQSFAPDSVAHLAAQAGVRYSLKEPRAYGHSNLDGFLEVLEASRADPATPVLYASSSSVYGANTKVPFHETDPVDRPVSLYAATKRANEVMAQSYAALFGLRLTGLRFFTVYGPWGRPDMAYWGFTEALLDGREINVFNHGRVWRDFTYVDEVTEAISRLLRTPGGGPDEPGRVVPEVPHRLFNIGNHTPVAVGDFLAILERLTGRTALRRDLPMQPGDVERTWADVSALQAATGFSPTTPLDVGLARFVEWYRGWRAGG
ncbi:NAD-dependent epimerase/dehydratase family protein [Roseococcus sp. SDR]|uniref:NAD-dependent epimerase/dehydratase family protein n=1 Tax=Roseococcus sp. SDR TaxID=2835532 RepID=UPI001BCCCC9B|nr:NAD-dependent epimerase/dehydratase family protein [Roseococcus sp. SDR]MBS7788971.1 NAD-dependent epimerase/dehydratase family protein [Roseococcus sp. SDR]MBV1844285.1 NAD-dependent epimerase/dehydratase family protein [Roseococcus sp. SDR]